MYSIYLEFGEARALWGGILTRGIKWTWRIVGNIFQKFFLIPLSKRRLGYFHAPFRRDNYFQVYYPQIKKAREKRALIKFGNTLEKVGYSIESCMALFEGLIYNCYEMNNLTIESIK